MKINTKGKIKVGKIYHLAAVLSLAALLGASAWYAWYAGGVFRG